MQKATLGQIHRDHCPVSIQCPASKEATQWRRQLSYSVYSHLLLLLRCQPLLLLQTTTTNVAVTGYRVVPQGAAIVPHPCFMQSSAQMLRCFPFLKMSSNQESSTLPSLKATLLDYHLSRMMNGIAWDTWTLLILPWSCVTNLINWNNKGSKSLQTNALNSCKTVSQKAIYANQQSPCLLHLSWHSSFIQ